jgi:hypothetical protein
VSWIYLYTLCTAPRATALCPILTPKVTGGLCSLHSRGKPFLHRSLCHRMSDVNRLAVPTLLRGLCVVVKPCNPKPKPMPSLHRNSLSMAIKAPSMPPAVPDRRVDVTVFGASKGGHYIGTYGEPPMSPLRHSAKRRLLVRSSRSRFGSSNGASGPGVARELQFKSHFKGEERGGRQKKGNVFRALARTARFCLGAHRPVSGHSGMC